MITVKKILLPTDFSQFSQHAEAYAVSLAELFGAEIHLLHVLQDLVALLPEPGVSLPMPQLYYDELKGSAEAGLKGMLTAEEGAGRTVVRVVRHGAPFLEILQYSREQAIDLIVLGTHGRSGLAHVLLGSVAERVVRKASCPVLTIRAPGHKFEHP